MVEDIDDIGRVYWHDGGNEVFSAHWTDFADRDTVIFTAGTDEDASEALELLETYLDSGDASAAENPMAVVK
ncbi:MAG: hypothetical protein ACFB14_08095 [Leptolyngbyaceae cyanobacterium]